jgi:hypothetical protein
MPREVPSALISKFRAFAEAGGAQASDPITIIDGVLSPSFKFGDRRIVLISLGDYMSLDAFVDTVRKSRPAAFDEPGIYDVLLAVVTGHFPETRIVVERGISIMSLHQVIGEVTGLPPGWSSSQHDLISQALEPVRVGQDFRLAALRAVLPDSMRDAGEWLSEVLTTWNRSASKIIYLRAEAGKGKSTLLADAVRTSVATSKGPLPLFVPLRALQRGLGVSWGEIAAVIGVVGPVAEQLAIGVRAGLVALVLDGLDEVAGRYDQNIVSQVLDIVFTQLQSANSTILISGRTTEATLLDARKSQEAGIELPESHEPAFAQYAASVVDSVVPQWRGLAERLPEPPVPVEVLNDQLPTARERAAILEWIEAVFEDLGKERSLFFVQSLACMARSYQLDGNQALVIRTGDEVTLADAPTYDICVLAAELACVREQDKIDPLARDLFTPRAQLELLTRYAVRASAEASIRTKLPTPNETTQFVFGIDPVNQNEEFTAVLRQIQKHALLFAGVTEGIRVGEWRPAFLSEWVRAALLCRAWQHREPSPPFTTEAIVRAERARLTYLHIIPELIAEDRLQDWPELVELLVANSNADSPEACANFWALLAGLLEEQRDEVLSRPIQIVELSDLSDIEFVGMIFGEEFSANLCVFVAAEFDNCTFRESAFTSCEFTRAKFVNCEFRNVVFRWCDGPIMFDGCSFVSCQFENTVGKTLPALVFQDCEFVTSRITQNDPPSGHETYGPICSFEDCEADQPVYNFVGGDWIGTEVRMIEGIAVRGTTAAKSPAELTLRALLKTFFPVRAGEGDQWQARGYIRSSAIGRGVVPDGAPNASALMDILLSQGFTKGGRTGHVYGPWSSVVGGGESGVAIRNELLKFFRSGISGPTTQALIAKINRAATW